jgi:hypothetical protein
MLQGWRPKNDLILYSVFGRLGIVNGLHPGQFFRAKAGTRPCVAAGAKVRDAALPTFLRGAMIAFSSVLRGIVSLKL